MNRQLLWAGAIVIIALAAAALMIWLRPDPLKEEPQANTPLVETIAFKAASGAIPVTVSGTVQPRDEVMIGAQVSGRLTYVNPAFREGQFVQAGAVLVRIEKTDYANQVRAAKADVAAQDVAVLQAREEVAIAQADLDRFNTRQNNRTRAAAATSNNASQSRILPPKSLSQSSDTQMAGDDSPKAGKPESGLATKEPQLRSAQAARARASANLANAQTALGRTRITVPFSGLVRDENANIGTLVQVGQSLGSVASTSAYEVKLFLTEDEAALIPGLLQRSGANMRADVFYEYGGLTYRWPAIIDRVDASLDETTRNVEVFLRVPNPLSGGTLVDADNDEKQSKQSSANPAPPLLLGAFVSAQIDGSSLDSYAAIPPAALRPGNTIWVVRDEKLRIVPVRVIQRSDTLAYVTTPALNQGGLLVTSNLSAPTDGMAVRVAGAEAQ